MARCIVVLALLIATLGTTRLFAFDHEHPAWQTVLRDYVTVKSTVRYQKLVYDLRENQRHPFTLYLTSLGVVTKKDYASWSASEQMAFLLNAYNALTIKLVTDHYPLKSIQDLGSLLASPWRQKFFRLLGGEIESLAELEDDYLRPKFKDYRIHAALSCAAASCPPLRREPYLASRLNAQLTEQMQLWLRNSALNRCDEAAKVLQLSPVLRDHRDDLVRWGGDLRRVLAKHGPDSCRRLLDAKTELTYLDYQWQLNEAN